MIIIKGPGQLIARGLPAERAAPLISSNAIKSGEKNQNRIFVQIFAQIFVQIPSNQVRRIITNRMTKICTALSIHFTFISHVFGFHFYFLQGELHPPSPLWERHKSSLDTQLWVGRPQVWVSFKKIWKYFYSSYNLSEPTSGLFLSLSLFEVSKSTFILLIIWGLLLSLSGFEFQVWVGRP